ncbi:unnamed protein product [Heterosigma akashiwo]
MLTKFESKSNRVKGLSFHPVRPWILASLHNGIIQLWDYRMGTLLDRFDEHDGPVRGVDFHKVQPLIVSGGDDYKIKVWDYKLRRCLFTLLGHLDYIRTVEFHNEYPWIVSASDDQTIRIWNWQSRGCVSVLTGHNHYVMCAGFHPKDDLIVSASLDQTVRVWDISGLRKKTVRGAPQRAEDATNMVARMNADLFGGTDAVVKYVLEGHDRGVNWAAFHPTLPLVISGADDRQVKLWRMNETKAWEVDTMRGHTNNVSCAIFHPRHELIVSDSEDRSVRVWDISKRMGVQTFRREHDRFWVLAAHPSANLLAAGHDAGLLVFKLGPAAAGARPARAPAASSPSGRCTCGCSSSPRGGTRPWSPCAGRARGSSQAWAARPGASPTTSSTPGGERFAAAGRRRGHLRARHLRARPLRLPGGEPRDLQPGRAAARSSRNSRRPGQEPPDPDQELPERGDQEGGPAAPADGLPVLRRRLGPRPAQDRGPGGALRAAVAARARGGAGAAREVRVLVPGRRARGAGLQARDRAGRPGPGAAVLGRGDRAGQVGRLGRAPPAVHLQVGRAERRPTTSNHVKYLLPNGDTGILRTLEAPLYICQASHLQALCLDREGKTRALELDCTEALFKLALEAKQCWRSDAAGLGFSRLSRQAVVGYLQDKGYPEVALHFLLPSSQNKTKKKCLKCGDIESAIATAYELNADDAWRRLGREALRQGKLEVVEMAYQRCRDLERLSFLYLVAGRTEKLRKMQLIAQKKGDLMSRFHNALYLGDAQERVAVLEAAGQTALAYLTASTHGLQEDADRLRQLLEASPPNKHTPQQTQTRAWAAGQPVPAPAAPPVLLQPPTPILRQEDWPLCRVTQSTFADYMDGTAAEVQAEAAADPFNAGEAAGAAWDDDLDFDEVQHAGPAGRPGGGRRAAAGTGAKPGGGAWEDDDLDFGDEDLDLGPAAPSPAQARGAEDEGGGAPRAARGPPPSPPQRPSGGGGGGGFALPEPGPLAPARWVQNSSHAADHAAAGSFESAMQLLNRQIAAVNFAPLRKHFLKVYHAAGAQLPGLPGTPALRLPLSRGAAAAAAAAARARRGGGEGRPASGAAARERPDRGAQERVPPLPRRAVRGAGGVRGHPDGGAADRGPRAQRGRRVPRDGRDLPRVHHRHPPQGGDRRVRRGPQAADGAGRLLHAPEPAARPPVAGPAPGHGLRLQAQELHHGGLLRAAAAGAAGHQLREERRPQAEGPEGAAEERADGVQRARAGLRRAQPLRRGRRRPRAHLPGFAGGDLSLLRKPLPAPARQRALCHLQHLPDWG